MALSPQIIPTAINQTILDGPFDLLHRKEQQIPGSVQFLIERYRMQPNWNVEDTAMMVYHYEESDPSKSYLQLRFCLAGNVYCQQSKAECNHCQLGTSHNCLERVESLDLVNFHFTPTHLSQLLKPGRKNQSITDEILMFEHKTDFARTLPICGKTTNALDGILNHEYTDDLENIYLNAQTQILLLYSLDCMLEHREIDTVRCKFLANEADREKIHEAREVLIKHIGEPITIKELSRKVAINECYLKKGFREIFGTTIFDFYQSQRMEHAKYLLYEKGLTVTDVSMLLGYSSISHFSTAFKNHTGLKPCELLFR
jgi:AraC-like DNA-binding protein